MRTFILIWSGQLVSRIGTGATRFALLIWTYQQTDSALAMALLSFFSFLPMMVVSPIAGVWVDRLPRRRVMWLSDAGAGLATLALLALFEMDGLALWHLYTVQAIGGALEAFQQPAFTALSTQLLPKEKYARAAGLRSVAEGGSLVATPVLAGMLLPLVGIAGVMVIDLVTLGLALATLARARVPGLPRETAGRAERVFARELAGGLRYIRARPGLVGLMGIYATFNLLDALTWFSLLPALVLARTGGDEMAMAAVEGAIGSAIVVGGLLVSWRGTPRRRIHGFLGGSALSFFIGGIAMALGSTPLVWIVGVWIAALLVPVVTSSHETILQSKVPESLQGRVFSVQNMVRQAMTPAGILLGGVLAERWLEPAMHVGGALHAPLSPLVGSGPGAGIAVLFLATAILGLVVGLGGYAIPALYRVEERLPDYDATPQLQPR